MWKILYCNSKVECEHYRVLKGIVFCRLMSYLQEIYPIKLASWSENREEIVYFWLELFIEMNHTDYFSLKEDIFSFIDTI